jgi:type IV pilus assembly protein PilF
MRKTGIAASVVSDRRTSLRTGLILAMVVLLLTACAGSPSNNSDKPDNRQKAAETNTALGMEYMERGQYEVALGKLKKALRAEPDYAPAHTVTAVLYERIGEDELAGKHYRMAYESAPSNGDVNNNYGVYLCQNGKSAQALDHFERALDDPFYRSPSVALTNAGSCALNAGDPVSADGYLRRALKIDPDFPDALISMVRLNYQKKDSLRTRAFLQRYEAVAEHNAESLLLAYRVETAANDSRSANKYKVLLESYYPDSSQAREVRRLSGQ